MAPHETTGEARRFVEGSTALQGNADYWTVERAGVTIFIGTREQFMAFVNELSILTVALANEPEPPAKVQDEPA